MELEHAYIKVKEALDILEKDYVVNINDFLFLDKKYGAKFVNLHNTKSLSLTGFVSILETSFDIKINHSDLALLLNDISSTEHIDFYKYVNVKDNNDLYYEIRFK